ncbi:MAG: UbiA family prenyltransferase [Saprospiraceae bacterium]
MPPLLRLLRFPNLAAVALTQALVVYWILRPAFAAAGLTARLSDWKVAELIGVTALVTASGYMINDLFDAPGDELNRPGTNMIVKLGKDLVGWLYGSMVLGGYLISLLLAFRLDELEWLWLYPVAVGLLAAYSPYLKKVPLLGNVLVAVYCAGVVGIVVLAERDTLGQLAVMDPALYRNVVRVLLLYSVLAFGATLLREIVKDLQDLSGDLVLGRRTLPIEVGGKFTKAVCYLIGSTLLLSLAWPFLRGWQFFLGGFLPWLFGLMLVAVFALLVGLQRAKEAAAYGRISTGLKFVLFGGVLLLFLFGLK